MPSSSCFFCRRAAAVFLATRVVSERVAGQQVRRDRPLVWRGRGVGGHAGHTRVFHRLVGGVPVGRGGSRCVAARPFSGRPSGGVFPLSARTRCRPAGVVRRGREHATRPAGRARPRGSAGRLRRSTRSAPHVCGPVSTFASRLTFSLSADPLPSTTSHTLSSHDLHATRSPTTPLPSVIPWHSV